MHSHDVEMLWNFWPLNDIIGTGLKTFLNIVFWPITMVTWWYWVLWNDGHWTSVLIIFVIQTVLSIVWIPLFMPPLIVVSIISLVMVMIMYMEQGPGSTESEKTVGELLFPLFNM